MSAKKTAHTWRPRRRSAVVLGGVAVIMVAFSVRLVDIQLVQADELVSQSQEHTGGSTTIAGVRGNITDQDGNVLAATILTYDVVIDPSQLTGEANAKNAAAWPTKAAQIAEITGQLGADIQKAVADSGSPQYALVKKGITTAQRQQLADLKIPYLSYQAVQARTYPDGAVGGNLVGFVGASDNGTGVKGLSGLEQTQETCLSATDGKSSYIRGTNGEMIPGSLKTTPAVDGGTVQLTINRDLQWYLQQMIGEEVQAEGAQSGTVTVIEVATGKIRAAAQYPTLDPNNVAASTEQQRKNLAFTDTFEPGSTFKAATAAMLLEQNAATPLSTEEVPASYTFSNGANVNDADQHRTENYTLAGALITSSNVGLSKFGERLSPEVRHDYLEKFGVGTKTGVGVFEESGGIAPANTWDNQSIYATTFGQAFTVTAAQVAGFYQGIANDGVKKPLQLVESCTAPDGTVTDGSDRADERIMSEKTSAQMRQLIENVAEQGGVSDAIRIPGYRIAAKTGTAQVSDGHGGYKKGVYYTSLVGFAPADDPQYVVMVTLDQPRVRNTSQAAAIPFNKAMTQVLKTYQVMPSATPFTDPLPITQ